MKKSNVIVIGSGVVGTTLAIQLAKQNYEVYLIERDWSMHHKIIGELMQPAGLVSLKNMQLEHIVSKHIDAQKVFGYIMNNGNEEYKINYDQNYDSNFGYGFRNGRFVQQLREETKKYSNIIRIEGNVTSLIEKNNRVEGCKYQIEKNQEKSIFANVTFICEGCFSMLRGKVSNSKKIATSYFLGLVLESVDASYSNYGTVMINQKHPLVMYPISPNEHRVLIDFEKTPRMGEKLKLELKNNLIPEIPKKLKINFINAIEKGEFKMMPNYRMSALPIKKEGVMLVGDSLNIRHPLTGGGMTVGLRDVEFFTKIIEDKDISNPIHFNQALQKFNKERTKYSSSINILADALYRVVKDKNLSKSVYSYLNRGGKYSLEPLQLLSGVLNDKRKLLKHFSVVAIWGARKNVDRFSWKKIKESNQMLKNASKFISPLLIDENPSFLEKVFLKMLNDE